MQKFSGKVAKLSDVMTGFGTVKSVMTEDEFLAALGSKKWQWLPLTTETPDGSKVVGYFNQFWVEEVDGEKCVFGAGFIYDEYDAKSVPALKNFSLEILPKRDGAKEVTPVGVSVDMDVTKDEQ